MSVSKILEREYKFFLENKEKLLKEYPNKYLVIKDQKVAGAYNEEIEALKEASQKYEIGTFLIQFCCPNEDDKKQTFHSRVMFNATTL